MHLLTEYNTFNYNNELELLLESTDNIQLISDKIKDRLIQLTSEDEVLDFFQYWVNKFAKLNRKIKIAFLTVLVTLCLTKVSSEALSNINIADPTAKNIVDKTIKDDANKKISNQNKEFLEAIANSESSNNWKSHKIGFVKKKNGSLSPISYIGKYQFGKYAFEDIGKKPIKYDDFKYNPKIYPEHVQDKDMIKLLKKNKKYLRNYISYIGKTLEGTEISESGMLAAAHLVGNYKLRQYLKSEGKIDPIDGNGVSCSDYIKKFNGYNLEL